MQSGERFNQNWQVISNKKLGEVNFNELFTFQGTEYTVFKITADMTTAKTVEVVDKPSWAGYRFVLPSFLDVQVVTYKH